MRFYRTFHFLSLDIVLGALATTCLGSRLLLAHPGWAWWIALAFTVWLLYTGDHLLDAWRHRKQSKREMHRFIFEHRRILLWAMGIIGSLDLILIFNFLESSMLKVALVLGGLVLLFYAMRHIFRRNQLFFLPGELFVLLLYLAGTWMGPFLARSVTLQPTHLIIAFMMSGILMLNLGIISLYDALIDTRLGISSIANRLGKRTTRNLMLSTAFGVLFLAVLQFLVFGADRTSQFAIILTGMTLVLLLVLLFPSRFRKQEAYRLLADAVLYMGFFSLLITM